MRKVLLFVFCLLLISRCNNFDGTSKNNTNDLMVEPNSIIFVNPSTGHMEPICTVKDKSFAAATLSLDNRTILLSRPNGFSYDFALLNLESGSTKTINIDTTADDNVIVGNLHFAIDWLDSNKVVVPYHNFIYDVEQGTKTVCPLKDHDRVCGYYINKDNRLYIVFYHDLESDFYGANTYNSDGELISAIKLPLSDDTIQISGVESDGVYIYSYSMPTLAMKITYYDTNTEKINFWEQLLVFYELNPDRETIVGIPFTYENHMTMGDMDGDSVVIYDLEGTKINGFKLPYSSTYGLVPEGLFWSIDNKELYLIITERANKEPNVTNDQTHFFKINLSNHDMELVLSLPYLCYVAGIDANKNVMLLANY